MTADTTPDRQYTTITLIFFPVNAESLRMLRGAMSLLLSACLISVSVPNQAYGNPIVSGFTVTTYANVVDPIRLSFDPSGVLYVGRDNTGSGGGSGDPVKIHRVGIGGSPVTEYGNNALDDPDAVLFDATGTISGTPGSVLVGGEPLPSGAGRISVIRPDQSIFTLFGPTTTFINPQDMEFDSIGRLLFTDINPASSTVFVSSGGFPGSLPICVGNPPRGLGDRAGVG